MKQPRSNYKKRMLEALGTPWTMKVIDGENCIYQNLGDYEISISGGQQRTSLFHIYVWKKSPIYTVVERHLNLNSHRDDIPAICSELVQRYARMNDGTTAKNDGEAVEEMEADERL